MDVAILSPHIFLFGMKGCKEDIRASLYFMHNMSKGMESLKKGKDKNICLSV
jgi:hypothetical protein